MNLFYLSHDSKRCAQYHCDRHTVKMIVELAQMLSTAHRLLDGRLVRRKILDSDKIIPHWEHSSLDGILYKATHINHPTSQWVRSTALAYDETLDILYYLCKEYTHRYKKIHKVESSGLFQVLMTFPKNIDKKSLYTLPPQAMPSIYKIDGNPIQAYRNYYIGEKLGFARWTNREIPYWIKEYANEIKIRDQQTT